MTSRANYFKLVPDVVKTMNAFSAAAVEGLDPAVASLVKLRASQINKCAFCLDMHMRGRARGGPRATSGSSCSTPGRSTDGIYTDKERAALALTEAVTVLTDGFVPDAVYDAGRRALRRGRNWPGWSARSS